MWFIMLMRLEPAALIILNIPKYLSTFRQLFTLNILSDFSGIRQHHYVEVGLQGFGAGGGGARNLGCRSGNPKQRCVYAFFLYAQRFGYPFKIIYFIGNFLPRVTRANLCLTFIASLPEPFLRLKES